MNIDKLNILELIQLNKKIINRLKVLQQQEILDAKEKFRIGDIVSFLSKDNKKIMGFVIATRRKSKIEIFTENDERWEISPILLKAKNKPSKKLTKIFDEFDGSSNLIKISYGNR